MTAACVPASTAPSTSSSTTSTATTSTTSSGGTVTETFSGVLPVLGTKFYSFSIASSGTITATLVSITGSGVPSTVQVNLGVGTPSAKSCATTGAQPVQVSGTASVSGDQPGGTYCVAVVDGGNLFAPATFTVSIVHP